MSTIKLCFLYFLSDINDCEKNGCMNNATCQDGVNSYDCLCRPGFTGDMCETSKSFTSFVHAKLLANIIK